MTFENLGLAVPILSALKEQGYKTPSPIQAKAIPPALHGRDILGCAQTGTGKTCAFAAPILQQLDQAPSSGAIRALILTPTRELAIQIDESFAAYGKYLHLRHAVIFGGVGQNAQVQALKDGVYILTATPGRLMDLYQQRLVDLSHLNIFVLDEADRMLDMGFIHDVRKILKWLPKKKQTMLFSATLPDEIADLVSSLLKDPVRIMVDPVSSPASAVEQSVYFVDKANKTRLLAALVEQFRVKNALVFTRTKHGANKVAQELMKMGISSAAIHGNKSQTARQQALASFKAGVVRCLVATDIAARGLDIEELSHVFNYNLPEVPETYVHRIGRTGRAGRGGIAIPFCDFGEQALLKDIEKLIRRPIPVVEGHPFPMQVFEAPKKDKHGRAINPEDAEARAAARELRRQRNAAKAAQTAPEASSAPEIPVPPVPRPVRSKRRPETKETPVSTPSSKSAAPSAEAPKKPRGRGVRAGILLETGDSMPRTDFYRPNPLDSDVIMDATARLLAPRKSIPVVQKSAAPQSDTKSGNGRKRKKKTSAEAQPAPKSPQKQPSSPHSASKVAAEKPDVKPAPPAKKKKSSGKASRNNRQRSPAEPMRSGKTKDSTEQESLMKPYYLDIGQ